MSVNLYDPSTGILTPVAGLTVPAPTPDYVDVQYNPSLTWIVGMTCISGNKRYRCLVNNTGSAYAPPNSTYWKEESVASEIDGGMGILAELLDTTTDKTITLSNGCDLVFKKLYYPSVAQNQKYRYLLGSAMYCNIVPITYIIDHLTWLNQKVLLNYPVSIESGAMTILRDDGYGTITGMAYQYYLEITQLATSNTIPVTVMLWYMVGH